MWNCVFSLGGQRIKKSLNPRIQKLQQGHYCEERRKLYPAMNSSVHCGFLMEGTQAEQKWDTGAGGGNNDQTQKKQKVSNTVIQWWENSLKCTIYRSVQTRSAPNGVFSPLEATGFRLQVVMAKFSPSHLHPALHPEDHSLSWKKSSQEPCSGACLLSLLKHGKKAIFHPPEIKKDRQVRAANPSEEISKQSM